MATLVEVRPLERKSWHGRVGAESFTRPKKFQVLVDPHTMKYAHGLSKEDIKALKAKGVTYDLSDDFNTEAPHPFWDSNMVMFKLENNTMFFDIDQPLNFIKVKAMKASRFVANSREEWEQGLFPEATHIIYDEKETISAKASKVAERQEATLKAAKLSTDKKLQVIRILSGKNLKGQSDDFINVEIDEIIQRAPVPGSNDESGATEFLRLLSQDSKETSNHALVLEALEKNVLRKDKHRIYYMDSVLGNSETEVGEFLSLDDNQDLKMIIQAKVNN